MGWIYRTLVRPFAFRLPPEQSHALAVASFRLGPLWRITGRLIAARDDALATEVAGLRLPSPVGLAAGFDKNCDVLPALLDAGFGYAVGGTVTLQPRPGNPRPRMVRDGSKQALVNALGFPGKGLDHAERRLRRLSPARAARIIVSISGAEVAEIVECHRRMEPLVAAVEVNISSPNTAGLVVFQQPGRLSELIREIAADKRKPLFVKLPRLNDTPAITALAVAAVDAGADGLVAANTLPVEDSRLAVGRGGLSGQPLFDSTIEIVTAVRDAVPGATAVIACGGISTPRQARVALDAGANAVQLYTALVYEGPGIAGAICRDLTRSPGRAQASS